MPKIMFAAFLLLFGCAGCGRRSSVQTSSVRPVKIYEVTPDRFIERSFAGLAGADEASNLAFKIAGQVIMFDVSEGESVERNRVLAEINPRDYQLTAQAALSAYQTARARLDRCERLLKHQAISRQEYELAQTAFIEAQSNYENAKGVLSDTRLLAPFAGIVEKKYVDLYQRIQPGETIVRLVNPVSRSVKFTMPESGIPLLREKDKQFRVEFDNYEGVWFSARLKDYVLSSTDGMGVPVSLNLDDERLKEAGNRYIITPGMSCTIVMSVEGSERPNGVAVPLTAIYAPVEGGTYVWVLDSSDHVNRRPVVLGEIFGIDMVSIAEGLSAGDRVVTAGVYRLHDGEQVKILGDK